MIRKNFSTLLFSLLVSTILVLGWLEKDEYWYTAENGLGYAFGIIGSTLMLLLLLYPARKYWKPMRHAFKVHHWFRLHMVFGVLGPVLILLHSNFSLGSLNSNIALFSMLLVAGSGLIGRYVYQKLHRGLYGEQIAFSDLDNDYQASKVHFANSPFFTDDVHILLDQIEEKLTQRIVPTTTSLWARRKIKKIKRLSNQLLKEITNEVDNINEEQKQLLQNYDTWILALNKLNKMANYALYARLFSLWHIFHLPIFFMMIITAIVHIFVVHMY